MAIFVMEPDEILGEAYQRLVSNTGVTKLTPGSTARALLEIISEDQGRLYSDISFNVAQTFVSKAVGENLDLIGVLLGVSRGQSSYPIDNTTLNFRFKIDPATGMTGANIASRMNDWLSRNGKVSAYVTANTFTIRAGAKINTRTNVVYVTLADAAFGSSDTVVSVPVMSLSSGSTANVGPGSLTSHNLVEHQQEFTPVSSVILADNIAPITNGKNVENDDEYRFRIVNKALASEACNETAIRLAVLAIPGVADIVMKNFSHGVGTFSVFVIGTDAIVSQGLINAVAAVVENKTAKGIRTSILRPVYRSLEMTVSLEFIPEAGDVQRQAAKVDVKKALVDYTNNIEMGSAFIINRAIQQAFSTSNIIRDAHITGMIVGEYNVDTKISERRTPIFTVNQSLFWDEKFYTTPGMITIC
jgi:hypothetical protein